MTAKADRTAFFDAIRAGDTARVDEMLKADPELMGARTETGESAVLLAVYSGREDVAKALIKRRPAVDIFEASAAGLLERVKQLIDKDDALLRTRSHDGWTPLHLAAFFGREDVADYLLEKGADVKAISANALQNTPLHAAMAGRHGHIAHRLLEHGADVNARQAGGYTVIHSAAQNGDTASIRLLVQQGADVNARTDKGETALAFARSKEQVEAAELLLSYGGSE